MRWKSAGDGRRRPVIAGVAAKLAATLAVLVFVPGLSACSTIQGPMANPDPGLMQPVLNPISDTNAELRDLPPPTSSVAVAVYGYTDQTGQFREGANFQTLSKAVTQGATSILVKALRDAGNGTWFTVVERERFNNLAQERRIITEMRKLYLGEKTVNPEALPPLLFAGILLEGGIIGFDSNTRTGGAGARYFGIGGDVEYRESTVTVYLRAVSTKTGEVLANAVSHKKILSYGVQGGVFRFIEFDRLLEAEAGFTKNEPEQLAVQQAIEKALLAVIAEGAARGVWSFADREYEQRFLEEYGERPKVVIASDARQRSRARWRAEAAEVFGESSTAASPVVAAATPHEGTQTASLDAEPPIGLRESKRVEVPDTPAVAIVRPAPEPAAPVAPPRGEKTRWTAVEAEEASGRDASGEDAPMEERVAADEGVAVEDQAAIAARLMAKSLAAASDQEGGAAPRQPPSE